MNIKEISSIFSKVRSNLLFEQRLKKKQKEKKKCNKIRNKPKNSKKRKIWQSENEILDKQIIIY